MRLLYKIAIIVAFAWNGWANYAAAQSSEGFDAPPADCSPYEQFYEVFPADLTDYPAAENMINIATCLFAKYPENQDAPQLAKFWLDYAILENHSPEAMYILALWLHSSDFQSALARTDENDDASSYFATANFTFLRSAWTGYEPAMRAIFELVKRSTCNSGREIMREATIYYWLRKLSDAGEVVDQEALAHARDLVPPVLNLWVDNPPEPFATQLSPIQLKLNWLEGPADLRGYSERRPE